MIVYAPLGEQTEIAPECNPPRGGARSSSIMELAIITLLFVLLGPAALVAGADSRPTDTRVCQSWWPGRRD